MFGDERQTIKGGVTDSFERYTAAIHPGIVSASWLRKSSEDAARLSRTGLCCYLEFGEMNLELL